MMKRLEINETQGKRSLKRKRVKYTADPILRAVDKVARQPVKDEGGSFSGSKEFVQTGLVE